MTLVSRRYTGAAQLTAFGVRRRHIRQWLLATNKRLEALSERMKREPEPKPANKMASKMLMMPTTKAVTRATLTSSPCFRSVPL